MSSRLNLQQFSQFDSPSTKSWIDGGVRPPSAVSRTTLSNEYYRKVAENSRTPVGTDPIQKRINGGFNSTRSLAPTAPSVTPSPTGFNPAASFVVPLADAGLRNTIGSVQNAIDRKLFPDRPANAPYLDSEKHWRDVPSLANPLSIFRNPFDTYLTRYTAELSKYKKDPRNYIPPPEFQRPGQRYPNPGEVAVPEQNYVTPPQGTPGKLYNVTVYFDPGNGQAGNYSVAPNVVAPFWYEKRVVNDTRRLELVSDGGATRGLILSSFPDSLSKAFGGITGAQPIDGGAPYTPGAFPTPPPTNNIPLSELERLRKGVGQGVPVPVQLPSDSISPSLRSPNSLTQPSNAPATSPTTAPPSPVPELRNSNAPATSPLRNPATVAPPLPQRSPSPSGSGSSPIPSPPTSLQCRYKDDDYSPLMSKLGEIQTTQNQHTVQLTAINAQSGTINNKLGDQMTGGIAGKLQRMAQATHLDKVMNALTLITVLHNAAMVSTSLVQTLGATLGEALSIIGLKDDDNQAININAIVGKSAEGLIQGIIGTENWTSMKTTWAKLNRTIAVGSNLLSSVRSMTDSVRAVVEFSAENTGRIGNALKRDRVVRQDSYKDMPENVNSGNAWSLKMQRMAEGLEGVESAASSISSVVSEVKSIQDEIKEIQDQKTEFRKSLEDLQPKETTANKAVKQKGDIEKTETRVSPSTEKIDREESSDSDP